MVDVCDPCDVCGDFGCDGGGWVRRFRSGVFFFRSVCFGVVQLFCVFWRRGGGEVLLFWDGAVVVCFGEEAVLNGWWWILLFWW